MLATLGCMIGRSERAPTEVEAYWEQGSTFPNFLYRCADGELIQVWFGGKGMYAKLIEVLGDEPSAEGYYTDQVKGALNERARPLAVVLRPAAPRRLDRAAARRRRRRASPCSRPARRSSDPHLAEIGLASPRSDGGHRRRRRRHADRRSARSRRRATRPSVATGAPRPCSTAPEAACSPGLRVLDFSAFVAGPLGAQVLADLGADVIKVEPPQGEAMRAAAYAVAACQRGKRSLALDINAPEARPVVERLIEWADVVLHNFRVGVSERLGIDEATVAAPQPTRRLLPRQRVRHDRAAGRRSQATTRSCRR